MIGHAIYVNKNEQLKVNKFLVTAGWILSVSFLLVNILFLGFNRKFQIIYREVIAISIGWIVFACHSLKSGGFIRSFLSHGYWQPFSKICLSIYLFHWAYETLTPTAFNDWWMKMAHHIFDTSFVIVLSTIFYLVIEAPFGKLTDIFMKFIDRKLSNNFEQLEMPIIETQTDDKVHEKSIPK